MKMNVLFLKAMLLFILIQIWMLQSRYLLVKIEENGKVEREQRMIVSRINSGFIQCLNCLTKVCEVMIGRFPKLCLDIAKEDIKTLWICAYTECARGDQIKEEAMKEDCAKLCR